MKLIVTIDTEEDEWGNFRSTGHSVKNIANIPELQAIFNRNEIKPTYLVNYAVASQDWAVDILKEVMLDQRCEIGSHCHPWNTPPYEEETSAFNSMLCNLPPILQKEKLSSLTHLIENKFGVKPVSFRSGRWAGSDSVADSLVELGYLVDSSITPYTNWSTYFGPDYSLRSPQMFWLRFGGEVAFERSLLEIPVSVGYLGGNFALKNEIHRVLSRRWIRRTRLIGLLDRLKLLKKVTLSPELSSVEEMISLSETMIDCGFEFLHMYFHSPTLKVGSTSYVKTSAERNVFLRKLESYFSYANFKGFKSISLSEVAIDHKASVVANGYFHDNKYLS